MHFSQKCLSSDLVGKPVLVTGSSSGIGRALAIGFAEAGSRVAVHYHKSKRGAEETVSIIRRFGGTAFVLQADLTLPGAADRLVDQAAEELGGIFTLINNAGGPIALVPIRTMDDGHFDRVFNLNARSVFAACRAAITHLMSQRGSSIINITSLSSHQGGSIGAGVYGAAKAFVSTLTKNLARELAPENIRVNALSPGLVETNLHRNTPRELIERWITEIPLGRAGEPADCIGAAIFLASPSLSGFITGQVVEVNGGQYMSG